MLERVDRPLGGIPVASDTLEPKLLQQGGKARDGLMRAVRGKSYLQAIQRELKFPD